MCLGNIVEVQYVISSIVRNCVLLHAIDLSKITCLSPAVHACAVYTTFAYGVTKL